MTREERAEWLKKSETGEVEDDLNPAFIFSGTWNPLLAMIARGEINCQELARRELETRGLDDSGKWVGFNKNK